MTKPQTVYEAERDDRIAKLFPLRDEALKALRSYLPATIDLGTLDKEDYAGKPLLYITARRSEQCYAVRFGIDDVFRHGTSYTEIYGAGATYERATNGRRHTPKYTEGKAGWPFKRMAREIEEALRVAERAAAIRSYRDTAYTASMRSLTEVRGAFRELPQSGPTSGMTLRAGPLTVRLSATYGADGKLRVDIGGPSTLTADQAIRLIEALRKLPPIE